MRIKKSLGQHFLTSQGAVEKMVLAGEILAEDTILEIGPGRGILTKRLLESGARVVAVEKADSLIPVLSKTFKKEIDSGQLDLVHADILQYELDTIPVPYKLIANIPYYITGEIIRLFLTADNKPTSMTLLVQKEVAERIVAKDGKESILSLSVKFFGMPIYVQTVKKGSFNPPPKVDSAIIHIEKIEARNKKLESRFFETIKAGFKSKRKKLISNLSPLYQKDTLASAFEKLHLSENTRAEEVDLSTWLDLIVQLNG